MPITFDYTGASQAGYAGSALIQGLLQGQVQKYLTDLQQALQERELALREKEQADQQQRIAEELALKQKQLDYMADLAQQKLAVETALRQQQLQQQIVLQGIKAGLEEERLRQDLAKHVTSLESKRLEKQTDLAAKWASISEKSRTELLKSLTDLRKAELFNKNRLDALRAKHEYAIEDALVKSDLEAVQLARELRKELALREGEMNITQKQKFAELQRAFDMIERTPLTKQERVNAYRELIKNFNGLKESIPIKIPFTEELKENVFYHPELNAFFIKNPKTGEIEFRRKPEDTKSRHQRLIEEAMQSLAKNPNVKELMDSDFQFKMTFQNLFRQASMRDPEYRVEVFGDLLPYFNEVESNISNISMALSSIPAHQLVQDKSFLKTAAETVSRFTDLRNEIENRIAQTAMMYQQTKNTIEGVVYKEQLQKLQNALDFLRMFNADVSGLVVFLSQGKLGTDTE